MCTSVKNLNNESVVIIFKGYMKVNPLMGGVEGVEEPLKPTNHPLELKYTMGQDIWAVTSPFNLMNN